MQSRKNNETVNTLPSPVDLRRSKKSISSRLHVPSEQRTAVITGGLNGIGKATVFALAEYGMAVAVLDQEEDASPATREMKEALSETGATFSYHQADVTSPDAVHSAIQSIVETHNCIDVLVNNVGTGMPPAAIEDMSLEDWDRVLRLNLTSAFLCARAAVPTMKAKQRGSIINLSSQAGRSRSEIGNLPYASAKAGVLGFTRQLATELGPFGIRVNAVAPGLTLTDRVAQRLASISDSRRTDMTAAVSLGRLARSEEIAAAIAFLASDASSYITGATIDVNGGRFML